MISFRFSSLLATAFAAFSYQCAFADQLLYSFQNSSAYMANNSFWAFTSNGITASQSVADNQCTDSSNCWSSGSVQLQQDGTSFSWTGLQSSSGQSLGDAGIYAADATNLSQPGTYQYSYGDNGGTGVLTISPVSELLYSFQDQGADQFSWSFTGPQLTSSHDIAAGQCQACLTVGFLPQGADFSFSALQVDSGQSIDGSAFVANAASFIKPGTYLYGYENDFAGDSGTGVLTVSLVTVPEPPLFGLVAIGLFALDLFCCWSACGSVAWWRRRFRPRSAETSLGAADKSVCATADLRRRAEAPAIQFRKAAAGRPK